MIYEYEIKLENADKIIELIENHTIHRIEYTEGHNMPFCSVRLGRHGEIYLTGNTWEVIPALRNAIGNLLERFHVFKVERFHYIDFFDFESGGNKIYLREEEKRLPKNKIETERLFYKTYSDIVLMYRAARIDLSCKKIKYEGCAKTDLVNKFEARIEMLKAELKCIELKDEYELRRKGDMAEYRKKMAKIRRTKNKRAAV